MVPHFYKRVNGEALAIVRLKNNPAGSHPGHIHMNTAVEGGGYLPLSQ
jgi:hypothetical protein